MARNIVPRTDKGADLGTPEKNWGTVYAGQVVADTVQGGNLGAVEQSAGDETTLRSLIANSGTNPLSITVYEDIPITTTDLTIPSNISLNFKDIGKLSPASGITLSIEGEIIAGLKQIFGGAGSLQLIRCCEYAMANWFGDVHTDIGDCIMQAIYACSPWGVPIHLPPGKFPVVTPIHYTGTSDRAIKIRIQGAGIAMAIDGYDGFPDESVNKYGTVLDGSALTVPVIKINTDPMLYNFEFYDFSVMAGTDDGIYAEGQYMLDNISVHGAGNRGFALYDNYNQLGYLNATFCNIGFYGYRLNACVIEKLTVRQCSGLYPVIIDEGSAFLINSLYIESNEKGMLNIKNNAQIKIGNFYTENNNSSNTAAYGVRIGDSTTKTLEIEINNWINTEVNQYSTALLYLDNVYSVTLNNCRLSGSNNILDFSDKGISFLNFNNCVPGILKLTNAPDWLSINFSNCYMTKNILLLPVSDLVAINIFSLFPAFDTSTNLVSIKQKNVNGATTLKPWETLVSVDSTSGVFMVTLPNERAVGDETYYIKCEGPNNTQVEGNIYIIESQAYHTLTPGQTGIFRYDHNNLRWKRLDTY